MNNESAANFTIKTVQDELHFLHLELNRLNKQITEIKEDLLILNPANTECVLRLIEKIKRL